MNDPTGSQRFSVFSVASFANKRLNAHGPFIEDFDIEGCWSFAYQKYKEGFNPEYSVEDLKENEHLNERYKFNSAEFELLQEYLEEGLKEDEKSEFMTTTALCSYLNSRQEGVFTSQKLGKALVRLGWKKEKYNERYGYWIIRKVST